MTEPYSNAHSETMRSFIVFAARHPELRFWQLLAEWSGYRVLAQGPDGATTDTLEWRGRRPWWDEDTRRYRRTPDGRGFEALVAATAKPTEGA